MQRYVHRQFYFLKEYSDLIDEGLQPKKKNLSDMGYINNVLNDAINEINDKQKI